MKNNNIKNSNVRKEKKETDIFPYAMVVAMALAGFGLIYLASNRSLFQNPTTTPTVSLAGDQSLPTKDVSSVEQVIVPVVVEDKNNAVQVKQKIIHNLDVNEDNTVLILGEIEDNAVAIAQDITRKAARNRKVNVLINSPGGSVMDGVLIISAIQAAHAEIDTVCLQICASMAAIIFEYGTKRYMVDRSTIMFHEAAGGLQGSFNQIGSRYTYFSRVFNKMNYEVASRAKKSPDEFRSRLANELWMDAEDSVQDNYADGIVNVTINVISDGSTGTLHNVSQTSNFLNKFRVFSK